MTDIVELALACYRRPLDYQDQFSLAVPLPEGMDRLLWLANGSPEALESGIRQTGAKPQELRDAARFCIQQWCLVRSADPHRVLGVAPDAPPEKIKEHYRLLMRLFHPDRTASHETWTDHYASRINEAWTLLSRPPDRTLPDSQPYPRYVPIHDVVHHPATERAVERPGARSSRYLPGRRLRAQRRWLPQLLAWGGLTVVAMMVLGEFYLDRFSAGRSGFEPTGAVDSGLPASATPVLEPVAPPAGSGAFSPFMAAPDWQALEQSERQAQRQVVQARAARQQWEEDRRQQMVADEALLESMREERIQLEEQIRIEQARMKRVRAERLADEQQRLTQLQAEQARVEQARVDRELAERHRLEVLQAEQAKAERLAEALRGERQRLEKLKAEQGRAERAKSEQAKMEQVEAERRLEKLKAEQARAERAKSEQAQLAPVADRAPAALMAVAAPDEGDLTARELESLMSRYIRAYQRGDLNSVMALFATGARSRIRENYATLFAAHQIRGLWLRDLRWIYHGQSASGSGRYELWLRRRDNGEPRQVEGGIRFTVQKRDNQVLIESIDYDWPES